MFKKNSWIVALLLALSLTAFFMTSCVDPLESEEEEEGTYTEVPLGKFNMWGGIKASQAGWAVAGIVSHEGIVAKDLGYKVEDFQNARFLVIETSNDSPGGVDLIWGAADEDAVNIGENWNNEGDAVNPPYGSFDKATKTLTIDLRKRIKDPVFRAKTTAKVKLLVQHPDLENWVVSAKLLVPEVKFVPIEDIKLNAVSIPGFTINLNDNVAFTPEDASEQVIRWTILSFLPDGQDASVAANWKNPPLTTSGTFTTEIATYRTNYVGFIEQEYATTQEKSYMDYTYDPPRKVVLVPAGAPVVGFSPNTIVTNALGKIKVRATVPGGAKEEKDYSKEFLIDVVSPVNAVLNTSNVTFGRNTDDTASNISSSAVTVKSAYFTDVAASGDNTNAKLTYKGNPVWRDTKDGVTTDYYVKSGTNYVLSEKTGSNTVYFADDGTKTYASPSGEAERLNYVTSGGRWNYGNGANWVAIKFDLGTKKLQDYSHLLFTLTGVSGDIWYKDSLLVHVSNSPFNPLTAWLDGSANNPQPAAKTANNLITSSSNATANVIVPISASSTGSIVYIALYYHVPGWSNSPFEIGNFNYSNIKLIPKP
jgi:hypothetical protein